MNERSAELRRWLYAMAWLGGGIALTVFSIWMVIEIRYDWPAGTEEQRLGILGIALYMVLSGPLLVMLGLGLRNAIRNLKASGGGFSVEANGHDSVTVSTDTTVSRAGEGE